VTVRIESLTPIPIQIPLARPFESARRRTTCAENVWVRARLSDSAEGWGEASPAAYVTGEDLASVQDAIPLASRALEGLDADRAVSWQDRLRELLPESPTARAAVEIALTDALARRAGWPLWRWLGGARRCLVSDLSIPICPPEEAAEAAVRAVRAGFRHLKIKVGGTSEEEDEARVRAICSAAPGTLLRVDANQGFQPDGALAFAQRLLAADVPLQLLEQPVAAADWEGMAYVTARAPVPVIADESVKSPADALRVAREGAAHGINIKLAKSGLTDSLAIIAIARAAGLQLMLGCMMESDLGIAAAVHLACGTGAFRYLDLDSHLLIGLSPPFAGFRQRGNALSVVSSGAGLGSPAVPMTTTAPAPQGTDAVTNCSLSG
jgi:L-alanine-DL-glutamate epimerase-like enolase superfamily enzyme